MNFLIQGILMFAADDCLFCDFIVDSDFLGSFSASTSQTPSPKVLFKIIIIKIK